MAFNLSGSIYSIYPHKHINLPKICTEFFWNLIAAVEGGLGGVSKVLEADRQTWKLKHDCIPC